MEPPVSETTSARSRARIFAALALTVLVASAAFATREAYRIATDAFVAPVILSPESELVLQAKAKATEVEIDQARARAEITALDADLASADRVLLRLHRVEEEVAASLDFPRALIKARQAASLAEIRALDREREGIATLARGAGDDGALRLALLQTERARRESDAAATGAYALLRSLRAGGEEEAAALREGERQAPLAPEAIARETELARIALETHRVESELRSKRAAREVALAKLAKVRELEDQMRARPIFRAMAGDLDVAFVPYSQEDGVVPGAPVLRCTWSMFRCGRVGAIAEIVPGEVTLPDPWGTPARGRLVVLTLADRSAAKSKVLRIRGEAAGAHARSPELLSRR